jgi:ribonuclease BN (tRNA processing enzyme)
MKLTVVGCSGSFPGPDSAASCYLVEYDGFRLLVDLGNGALGALARHLPISKIDAVIISHLHADHCLDLTSLFVARRYGPAGVPPLLPVYGPAGTQRRIADAYKAGSSDDSLSQVFEFVEIAAGTFQIGPFQVTAARMDHPVEAFGFRVAAGGRSFAYSGDTGPTPALAELARGSDLALFEASFLAGADNPPNLHLTAAQAVEHARAAGVSRLILTHLVPWNDQEETLAEAVATGFGDVVLAHAGLVVSV